MEPNTNTNEAAKLLCHKISHILNCPLNTEEVETLTDLNFATFFEDIDEACENFIKFCTPGDNEIVSTVD